MQKQKILTVNFPQTLAVRVRVFAANQDTSRSEILRRAAEEFLAKHENPGDGSNRGTKEGANETDHQRA